jgi:hypothetical protein
MKNFNYGRNLALKMDQVVKNVGHEECSLASSCAM